MKICVLGLGNMGLPVAVNLARAGHDVTGATIAAVPAASEAGVAVTTDATLALRDREVTFCLLPDLPYLEPMLPALIEGGTRDLVVMSTVSPTRVRELAERLRGQVNVLDACMSGGVAKASDGTMSIMCGGADAAFERLRPLLEVIGGTVELMGTVGAGAVTKACNQMVVAGTLIALAEATLVAKDYGLDAHRVLASLDRGAHRVALDCYTGPVLPESTAPGIEALRAEVATTLRESLLADAAVDTLVAFARLDECADDAPRWTTCLRRLPARSPQRAGVVAHLEALEVSLA